MGAGAFRFWQRWLFWASVGTGAFGVGVALFDTRLLPGFPEAVAGAVWGTPEMPREVVTYHRFVHAVLGATLAAWSVLLAFVAHGPFRARERWAWWAAVASLAAWFPLDTAMSLAFGVWPNALLNLGSLLVLGAPLAFTWRAFREPPPGGSPSGSQEP